MPVYHMVLDYKGRNDIGNWTCINYLQYVLSRWGLRTPHAASGLPNPNHLEGEVQFDQAQDQQVVTARRPHSNRVFTYSLDVD